MHINSVLKLMNKIVYNLVSKKKSLVLKSTLFKCKNSKTVTRTIMQYRTVSGLARLFIRVSLNLGISVIQNSSIAIYLID